MALFGWLVYLSAAAPLTAALRANRSTSLFHALVWAGLAWAGWGLAFGLDAKAWSYLALGLTGCAGVAVLGARRPAVAAWNFVVLGLLAVLLLPLAEGALLGTPLQLGTVRTLFVGVLLAVTVVNYLPTRLGGGATLLGVGCTVGLIHLSSHETMSAGRPWVMGCLGLAPWAAWAGLRLSRGVQMPLDRLWRDFRDRFGLVWGQRLREQFNRAAANAGLGVELGWWGVRTDGLKKDGGRRTEDGIREAPSDSVLRPPSSVLATPVYETLAALMKRFGRP